MPAPRKPRTSTALGRGKQGQKVRDAYADAQARLRGSEKGKIATEKGSAFKGAVSIAAKQKAGKK